MHLYEKHDKTLWEHFGLLNQIEQVHSREVLMPSGGRLVFDQTEALMAIDINSGKIGGKTNFEAMAFRTNMEAATAIARQLRLRDIGGQIVIDFIEMRDPEHCREVEKELRNAMKGDRARHDIGKMSSFGLLQIVRQRTGSSAISISMETCPHCKGTASAAIWSGSPYRRFATCTAPCAALRRRGRPSTPTAWTLSSGCIF